MSMILDAEKRAKDHIVFALKTRRREEDKRIEDNSVRPQIRLPLTPKEPVNVEIALDEIVARFPRTLDYLAK
jgi:hypothetical protein